ncbi:MAG: efflux RND transporter permease subunit, partial [Candidatus Krumholzibacteria bacterium]|nr:efflux RND transporter permease subunit [Candidatus Krumholzibacteria bacterium]
MNAFIRFFAERHLLANLLTIFIVLLGVSSFTRIKRDIFPSVDLDRLVITTRYPGASAEDVELNVTNPIEDELTGVDGIDQMTSYSMENISVINVALDPDAKDKEKIKRDIRDAVDRVTEFPKEVTDSPYIKEIKSENFEVIVVGLTGDVPYSELRGLAKEFEKKLEDIRGVSRVEKSGYLDREIKVEVSQAAMERYQVSMREIVNAIQMRNVRATGGSFESYTSDKNIVALAQFRDPKQVEKVTVRSTFEGPHILVKDLAVITDEFEPEKTRFHMNGETAIAFTVFKKNSADVIRVVNAIKELMERERERLPEGVELTYSYDMSRYVKTRLSVLSTNALIGLFLVVLVLFTFLNFRMAFWVAMGIPLALLGVVFVSPFFDVHIEIISMTGMIIIVGLIVDDAIVVAENIHRRRELGDSPVDAAVKGTRGVIRPVFATIVTTVLAFTPFFFMSGIMGKFMFSFPLVIVAAVLISFVEVILILPAHVTAGKSYAANPGGLKNRRSWFDAVKRRFQRLIVYVLAFRYGVVFVFLLLL